MSAHLESVPEEGTLFSPKPYMRTRVAVDLSSDKNKPVSDPEAAELERVYGTDELIECRVACSIKETKHNPFTGHQTYILSVVDVSLVDEDEKLLKP